MHAQHDQPPQHAQPALPDQTARSDQSYPSYQSDPPPQPLSLILASASPRRRELLARLGIPFTIIVAAVTEHEDPATPPRALVAYNAALKADHIAALHPNALVLGADTTVSIDTITLNKPATHDEARAMLKRLSGRTHTVHTAIALRCHARNLRIDETTTSQVTFKPLDDPTIDAYLRIVNPLDKAGAYGIQEGRHLIIDHYEGSLTNIMGLPLETLPPHLTHCGYQITN